MRKRPGVRLRGKKKKQQNLCEKPESFEMLYETIVYHSCFVGMRKVLVIYLVPIPTDDKTRSISAGIIITIVIIICTLSFLALFHVHIYTHTRT